MNGNFRLSAANRNRKWKFVFLGRPTINGKEQLLFQQTCPSMLVRNTFKILKWGAGDSLGRRQRRKPFGG